MPKKSGGGVDGSRLGSGAHGAAINRRTRTTGRVERRGDRMIGDEAHLTLKRPDTEFLAAPEFQFPQEGADVLPYGSLAKAMPGRNFLIGQPFADCVKDLSFPRGEVDNLVRGLPFHLNRFVSH